MLCHQWSSELPCHHHQWKSVPWPASSKLNQATSLVIQGCGGKDQALVRRKPRFGLRFLSIICKSSRAAGSSEKHERPCLTRAFDPGHRPVYDPSSRRHHAIGQSPLSALPGRCRSTLALGPSGGADPPMDSRSWRPASGRAGSISLAMTDKRYHN
jgi:hypothetical protein